MPSSGLLSKMFKRKDKSDSSLNHSMTPTSSNNVNSTNDVKKTSSRNTLEVPQSVQMNNSSSSASFLHPVDSHSSNLPHLKLARFLEKRHLKHHEFVDLHLNFNNLKINDKQHKPDKSGSTTPVGPQDSKFADYDALVKLSAKYGIIPDNSIDLMKLLEKTSEENQGNIEETFDVPESKDVTTALVIGKGAGGSVYPLYDKKNNHLYAMKKLRLQTQKENWKTYEKKLHNEFQIANKLRHQNLIRTYDLLQDNDLFIIIMDYAPYDFFTMIMAGVAEKHEIYCYFKQMCTGVHYMHSIGLAHRDLKLDNCVVDRNGVLKIVDFGSSVIFDQKRYDGTGKSSKNEQASGILGSDPYLAPEVVTYPWYDPALADVWSLAIIYCCMILKRFPWRLPKNSDTSFQYFSMEPGEITDKNGQKKIVGPDRLLRLLPSSSKHLMDHMLKIKPEERFTMDDVVASHFYQKISACHYVDYNTETSRGKFVPGNDHTHHLITNKEFEEKNPEEARLEKEREEKQAREILAQNETN